MIKNKDGSMTLSAIEVAALELIVGEWEEEAEENLQANGESTVVQNAFIIEFVVKKMMT